jgi:hypothetical protein
MAPDQPGSVISSWRKRSKSPSPKGALPCRLDQRFCPKLPAAEPEMSISSM